MPTLQVRDLPEDVYQQLSYLAEKDHCSLAQDTIVLLKESLANQMANKNRRKKMLEDFQGLDLKDRDLPDPSDLIRQDRDSR